MLNETLDAIDRVILKILQKDGRIANVELAEQAGLSPSPCARRVRNLEEAGIISRYAALIDQKAVGLSVNVFVNVTLERQVKDALQNFEAEILKRPEVMECYLMTGEADYFLRVVVADLDAYERFLVEHLTRIPGIANIKSSFALKQIAYRTELPIR
ncbi:MAG: Lrp/AsnC family transcriptional regulator [Hyphomicrobiales bacterium]|nr:Lrp/AsnC family transcriptional regulator [Hyphomicrobiales bacterium]